MAAPTEEDYYRNLGSSQQILLGEIDGRWTFKDGRWQKNENRYRVTPSTGIVFVDALPFEECAPQLVPPFLTPEGVTVLYGPGGVGKGYVSVWMALQIVRFSGKRVTVVDFENHPREWGRRVRALGYSEAERHLVQYVSPFSPDWTVARGTMREISDALKPDLDDPEHHTDYLIVDSYSTATGTEEGLGGLKAAQELFLSLAELNRPALILAHVTGQSEKWPSRPFGSVFIHNLARETWAVERIAGEEPDETEEAEPGPMTLELRQRKSNAGLHSKPQFLTFNFKAGNVTVDRAAPFKVTLADLAFKSLRKSQTIAELRKTILEDHGQALSAQTLQKAMERDPGRFTKTEDVPRRWKRVP